MKKTLFFAVLVVLSFSAFATDYEDGYRQGYVDAASGVESRYVLNKGGDAKKTAGQNTTWAVKYYVKQNGKPSERAYVRNARYGRGLYNTPNLKNGKLSWYYIIDDESVSIVLLEDNDTDNRVTGSFDQPVRYQITVTDVSSGTSMIFTGVNRDDKVVVENGDDFRDILSRGVSIKVKLVREDNRRYEYVLDEFSCADYSKSYRTVYR